jgi:Prenyltransferase and squalene oxidase repeat
MKAPSMKFPRPLRGLWALFLTLALAAAALPATAAAYVTPAQAAHAAERGAGWFESTQTASGALKSDWGMTALAATGVNSADVRAGLADPSAQDYYLGEWQAAGPGGAATDAERGILAGVAGGIQPSRLAATTEAEKGNLVARVAELFDGTQVGSTGLLNDDIFGVLALNQVGAPQPLLQRLVDYLRTKQLADGGWSWSASPSASEDTDTTGAAIAAFCAAGVPTSDPALARALELLHSLQDPTTGGFLAPPPFGVGVNADTTAWVTSGLIQCDIDPQSPEWTTAEGKTPLDYLVSLQRPDGHFDWTDEFAGGAFETYDAVRPLAGVAFSTGAPARLDGTSPAVRPAAAVAEGTTVPVTLVIDHGPANADVRMCRVDVPSGADLETLLATAESESAPSDCVSEFATAAAEGGTAIDSLDGVAADSDYRWKVRVDGGPASVASSEPIGFGDLVFLQYGAVVANPGPAPRVEVPPVGASAQPQAEARTVRARVSITSRASWRDGALAVALSCPRGVGAAGCSGLLAVRFHAHAGGKLRLGGSTEYRLAAGSGGMVELTANGALRRRLARGGRVWVQLLAVTRGEAGEAWVTRAKRYVSG